jgi:hypothetical protein
MKKLKLILVLTVIGFITMSMGFPADLTNERIRDESEKKDCLLETESNVVVMSPAESGTTYTQTKPIHNLSILPADYSVMTVKVFNSKGLLVMMQKISRDDFLASNENLALPKGSAFVMLHESTAYYFLEAGLMN